MYIMQEINQQVQDYVRHTLFCDLCLEILINP